MSHAIMSSASLALRRAAASDVSSTMIGTVLGQLVLVAASPILTRLYSPAELGGFAVFLGVAATLGVVGALGYQLAIPLPDNRRVAANVCALAAAILLTSSAVIGVVGWGARWIPAVGPLGPWLWFLGPTVLAICGFQVVFMWTTREGNFRGAGVARLGQATAQTVGQIGAGLLRMGSAGLIVAYTCAQFVGLGRLWRISEFPGRAVSFRRMKAVARRYRQFPQLTMWGSLANSAGTQLPAVMVGSLYGLTVAGQFALALRVLALPSALVGQAFAQVFYPKAAAVAGRPDQVRRTLERAIGILLLASLTCFVPIVALGGELFGLAFGAEWRTAGEYGRWIAVWSAVTLVSSPVGSVYLIAGRQRAGLLFSVVDAVVKVLSLVVGGWIGGAATAIHAFALAAAASYLVFHGWTLSLVGLTLRRWLAGYWKEGAAAGAVLCATLWLRTTVPVIPLWAAGTFLIALACSPRAAQLLAGETPHNG